MPEISIFYLNEVCAITELSIAAQIAPFVQCSNVSISSEVNSLTIKLKRCLTFCKNPVKAGEISIGLALDI